MNDERTHRPSHIRQPLKQHETQNTQSGRKHDGGRRTTRDNGGGSGGETTTGDGGEATTGDGDG